jgi:hypothetical protein
MDLWSRSRLWQERYQVRPSRSAVLAVYLLHHIPRSSAIIQSMKQISSTGSAYLAYFYFDFKDTTKQDSRGLLCSLLDQLCDQSHSFFDILLHLYSTHRRGSDKPSDDALLQSLEDMLRIAGQVPVYLIIDAVDECPDDRGIPSARGKVLASLEELVELHLSSLRLCVTSRVESDIRTVLEPLTSNRISLHDQSGQNEDIVDYIRSVVYSDKMMKRWRAVDKELVIDTLSDRAGGM